MCIEKYLRVPMKIERLIQLPQKELRNFDLYVGQDVDFFDDSTIIYLDDYIEEDDTGEEIYPQFSLERNLRWIYFGLDIVDIIIVTKEGLLQHPDINASLENFNYYGITKAVEIKFPQVEISDGKLPYIVAGDFAGYLLKMYQNSNMTELIRGLDLIEKLHHSTYPKVQELATIGYLEGIQNVWGNNEVNPKAIFDYLGSESKKWWVELSKFWRKEIKYIGQTYEKNN